MHGGKVLSGKGISALNVLIGGKLGRDYSVDLVPTHGGGDIIRQRKEVGGVIPKGDSRLITNGSTIFLGEGVGQAIEVLMNGTSHGRVGLLVGFTDGENGRIQTSSVI